MVKEFRDFVLRGNVVDLAIAVMIAGPALYEGHGRTSYHPSPRPRGSVSPIDRFTYVVVGATTTLTTRSGTFGEPGGTRYARTRASVPAEGMRASGPFGAASVCRPRFCVTATTFVPAYFAHA